MKEHEVFMKYLWISHAATSVPANHRTGALSSSTSCPKRTDGRSVAEAQAVPGGRVDVVMTSSPWHRAVAARSWPLAMGRRRDVRAEVTRGADEDEDEDEVPAPDLRHHQVHSLSRPASPPQTQVDLAGFRCWTSS